MYVCDKIYSLYWAGGENHGTMILYGVSYSAYTLRYGSYCAYRIAPSSQSPSDLLRSFIERVPWVILSSLGVCRHPMFPFQCSAVNTIRSTSSFQDSWPSLWQGCINTLVSSTSRLPYHATEGEWGCSRGRRIHSSTSTARWNYTGGLPSNVVWNDRQSFRRIHRNNAGDIWRAISINWSWTRSWRRWHRNGSAWSTPRAGRSAATSRHGGRRAGKHQDSQAHGGRCTTVQAIRGNSCFADRVDLDLMRSTSSGDDCTELPAPPCSGENALEDKRAAAPKSCLPSLEMHLPTAAGDLVPTGETPTATKTTYNETLLPLYATEETNPKEKKLRTSIHPPRTTAASENCLLPPPAWGLSKQNRCKIWRSIHACPGLGSWRALLCGEVMRAGAAGRDCSGFWRIDDSGLESLQESRTGKIFMPYV